MVALAEKTGTILCGGSSLEHLEPVKKLAELVKEKDGEIYGGHVTAPVKMDNLYGGFWFYTQHLTIVATTIRPQAIYVAGLYEPVKIKLLSTDS